MPKTIWPQNTEIDLSGESAGISVDRQRISEL